MLVEPTPDLIPGVRIVTPVDVGGAEEQPPEPDEQHQEGTASFHQPRVVREHDDEDNVSGDKPPVRQFHQAQENRVDREGGVVHHMRDHQQEQEEVGCPHPAHHLPGRVRLGITVRHVVVVVVVGIDLTPQLLRRLEHRAPQQHEAEVGDAQAEEHLVIDDQRQVILHGAPLEQRVHHVLAERQVVDTSGHQRDEAADEPQRRLEALAVPLNDQGDEAEAGHQVEELRDDVDGTDRRPDLRLHPVGESQHCEQRQVPLRCIPKDRERMRVMGVSVALTFLTILVVFHFLTRARADENDAKDESGEESNDRAKSEPHETSRATPCE